MTYPELVKQRSLSGAVSGAVEFIGSGHAVLN